MSYLMYRNYKRCTKFPLSVPYPVCNATLHIVYNFMTDEVGLRVHKNRKYSKNSSARQYQITKLFH